MNTVKMLGMVAAVVAVAAFSFAANAEAGKCWPTMKHFADVGFPEAGCPWRNNNAMKPMADNICKIGVFGFIETTWHHLCGNELEKEKMCQSASHAACGSVVSHCVSFQRSLRLVGNDMKITDCFDTGYLNYRVPPCVAGGQLTL